LSDSPDYQFQVTEVFDKPIQIFYITLIKVFLLKNLLIQEDDITVSEYFIYLEQILQVCFE